MNLSEAGLFLFCLNHAWVNDGLPEEPVEIARALRINLKEFNRNWPRVAGSFPRGVDARLRNPRQEEERALAGKKSLSSAESAKRRWEGHANAYDSQCQGTARAYDSDSVVDLNTKNRNQNLVAREADDQFGRLLEVLDAAEMRGSETDLAAARAQWNILSLADRLAAVAGIKDRIAVGEFADPGFRPLPQNYLKNKIWQRAVREKRSPALDKVHAQRNEVLGMLQVLQGRKVK